MDVEPSWGPDGSRVASPRPITGQDFDIAIIAHGSGRMRVTSGPAWTRSLHGLRTGSGSRSRVAAAGASTSMRSIRTGRACTRLTSSTCEDTEPSWSPDGSRIVFTSRRGGSPHVWVMNADGTGEHKLVDAGASSPAWSPDGKTVAYVGDADGDSEIYTVGANGQERHPVDRRTPGSPIRGRHGRRTRRCSPSRATVTATAKSSRCAPTAAPSTFSSAACGPTTRPPGAL